MINVFDCETYEDNGDVCIYCISYSINNEIYSIYKNEQNNQDIVIDFLNELLTKVRTNFILFYIHNIDFDGMLLLDSVFKNKLIFEWNIQNTSIYMIKIKYLNLSVEFRCSYKLIPISLKYLSNIGNNSQKIIFPYKFVKKYNLNYIGSIPDKFFFTEDVTDEDYIKYKKTRINFNLKNETIIYCQNDVKITLNLINTLLTVINKKYLPLLNKSYSAPSLSYKIFFKYWNLNNIKKNILKEEDAYVRKSYFGGRCEVFGNPFKNEKTHYFDFSGMYEQCMLQKFPIGDGFFKYENLSYKKIGFHCIKFKSDMEYPVLPHHSENGKLIFSNGYFIGCYWYEEIMLFIDCGGEVIEHYSSYEFNEEGPVFKSFIEEFSNIKKRGNIYKIFAKLMINSLYGGFAMNEKDYETYLCFSEKEADVLNEKTDVLAYVKKNNCHIFKILKNKKSTIFLNKEEKRWSNQFSTRNVIYASIIASKARIKLYRAMQDVLKSGGRLFYCDTDSIAAGYKINKINEVCGEVNWSELWDDAVFISPKFYAYKKNGAEVIKIKGISKNQYSFKEIKEAFFSNKKNLSYDDELIFFKKEFKIKQSYVQKLIFLNNYDKRAFSKNKYFTTPLTTHSISE